MLPLSLVLLPLSALAQDIPAPMQRFCLSNEATAEEKEIVAPIDALKAANALLDQGSMLTITGSKATFQDAWIGGPDFLVRANHNNVVLMDRGLLMEGGAGCNAWHQEYGSAPNCDWKIAPLPRVDMSAEVSDTAYMVWETLVLTGNDLTMIRVMSGGREISTETYACDDPQELLRYMRKSD